MTRQKVVPQLAIAKQVKAKPGSIANNNEFHAYYVVGAKLAPCLQHFAHAQRCHNGKFKPKNITTDSTIIKLSNTNICQHKTSLCSHIHIASTAIKESRVITL